MKQKTLDFFVDEQFIRAPHHRVVADSRGFLTARFSFGEAWRGLTKTAVFLGADGRTYHVLLTDDTCEVPPQVLRPTQFFVSVFGGDRLTTDRAAVEVAASGFAEGVTPPPTTPDIYSQLTAVVAEKQQAAETAAKAAETANAAAQDAMTKGNAAAVTAAVSADSAESFARASEFFAEQSTDDADDAKAAKAAAETAAAAAAEDAASATRSATAAEQSATAAAAAAATATASAALLTEQCVKKYFAFISEPEGKTQFTYDLVAEAGKRYTLLGVRVVTVTMGEVLCDVFSDDFTYSGSDNACSVTVRLSEPMPEPFIITITYAVEEGE